MCRQDGLDVEYASILELPDIRLDACICDNGLEHFTTEDIERFFANLKLKMNSGGRLVAIVPGKSGYKKDPTHKTFVTRPLMESLCSAHNIKLRKSFYAPINIGFVCDILYLNMVVFVIEF